MTLKSTIRWRQLFLLRKPRLLIYLQLQSLTEREVQYLRNINLPGPILTHYLVILFEFHTKNVSQNYLIIFLYLLYICTKFLRTIDRKLTYSL